MLELGDLTEDCGPVADGAGADAPDLSVLEDDGLARRLVLRDRGRAEEAERDQVLQVFQFELPRREGLIVEDSLCNNNLSFFPYMYIYIVCLF